MSQENDLELYKKRTFKQSVRILIELKAWDR
jgi:hypothetical protein